jgi:predicted RNA-binding Zn-ribbon protein involved in translation (DUF1610 family)
MSKNLPSYQCPLCGGNMRFCTVEQREPNTLDYEPETELIDVYKCENCGHEKYPEDVENEELDLMKIAERTLSKSQKRKNSQK